LLEIIKIKKVDFFKYFLKFLGYNKVMSLSNDQISLIKTKAKEIRISIIEMLSEAKSGHSAGALGMADIFSALYSVILKKEDRLVLSNGHICPALYAALSSAGIISKEELKTLRKFGSKLQGHPHREFLSALETSSGPLGSGLSQAVGMAIADKIDDKNYLKLPKRFIYCLMSDGELDEGQSWEAVMLGAKEKLVNLIAIVDRNNIQIGGSTEEVMPLSPVGASLFDKCKAFNWYVQEIDGHNIEAINESILKAQTNLNRPSVIIAHTVPGKGVSFMEGRYEWHGIPPGIQDVSGAPKKEKQTESALKELSI
jgi:transketolase